MKTLQHPLLHFRYYPNTVSPLHTNLQVSDFQRCKHACQGLYASCCVCVLVAQSCPTLCDPMDCSLLDSSVHGIFQAGILEWVAIPSPGDLSDPGIIHGSPILHEYSLASEPSRILYHYVMPFFHCSRCFTVYFLFLFS